MDELDLPGGAPSWDGVERRARCSQPQDVEPAREPVRLNGERLGQQILVGIGSTVGASAVIWVVEFLASHLDVHWH
ncbi:hypothetical protein ACIRST_41180 [Kitasatospora sp. NPDC101447]|uniref:hypothetical protein n=1 Tax=Kitasatospora sp. NPDC101447 TaxID=3364102 RepID=UPI00382E0E74